MIRRALIHRFSVTVSLLAVAATAARAQEIRVITEGMTHQEVLNTFGQPFSTRIKGNVLQLYYRNNCRSSCPDDIVVLTGGRVVSASVFSPNRRIQSRAATRLPEPGGELGADVDMPRKREGCVHMDRR